MNRLLTHSGKIQAVLWSAIWMTLPLSIRLNSMAISLSVLVFATLALLSPARLNQKQLWHMVWPMLYFLVQLIPDSGRLLDYHTLKEVEQQLPLLAIPLLMILGKGDKETWTRIAVNTLFYALIAGSLIMVTASVADYRATSDFAAFTYHRLSNPLSTGAIYFSFFIVVVLLRIDQVKPPFNHRWPVIAGAAILTIMLFLLASKLMLTAGLVLLLIRHARTILRNLPHKIIIGPVILVAIMLLLYPVSRRFYDISHPRLDIVMNQQYNYDSPMNGLNLRLIQTRLGLGILNRNNAWLTGVGAGKSQELLDQQYTEKKMYTGDIHTHDRGYLGYNFHNQYMETLVRSGIAGLLVLLTMFFVLWKSSPQSLYATRWEIALMAVFMLTESVLERQVGIVYFSMLYAAFFPIFNKERTA